MPTDNRPRPETPERHLWRGLAVPVTRIGGDYWNSARTLDVIWSSIILILGTRIGTRIMRPEFGSRIPELVFEQNDEILETLAKRYTIDAINRWESRINIQDTYILLGENAFTIGIIFVVQTLEGRFDGRLSAYRSQSFKILEQYWNQVS